MEAILTRKQFEEEYTGWWYWDVNEDYEKYLQYQKENLNSWSRDNIS